MSDRGRDSKGRFSSSWDDKQFQDRLDGLMPTIGRGVEAIFSRQASVSETYMKANAPWTDRTSNARNGLRAKAEVTVGKEHRLHLFHSVPYGLWLEVRWAGRYSIIPDAMHAAGVQLLAAIDGLLARVKS